MSDFDLQGLAQVSVSVNIPAHKRIVNDAISGINSLQSDLTATKAEIERLRGRAERMRQAGNRVISYGAPHIEWLTAIDHTIDPSPWLLRKQAEAVCEFVGRFPRLTEEGRSEHGDLTVARETLEREAQRLRQQAEAAEKGGDDDQP